MAIQKLVGWLLVFIGFILFIDELALLNIPGVPVSGWLLGDLSEWHIIGLHHWMYGLVMMCFGVPLALSSEDRI